MGITDYVQIREQLNVREQLCKRNNWQHSTSEILLILGNGKPVKPIYVLYIIYAMQSRENLF